MLSTSLARFSKHAVQPISPAPLVWFRVAFGVLMLFSTIRFVANGWVYDFYIQPGFMFKYPMFGWVQALPGVLMYVPFVLMATGAVMLALGWRYRLGAVVFFVAFTYVELLDATYYLNHYYFVSLAALLLVLLPAHLSHSVDARHGRVQAQPTLPRYVVYAPACLLGLVYVYAGLAKINSDWLLHALPLKIWLPANSHLPLVGGLLALPQTAYVFSWFGCLYDLFIPFLLLWQPTRYWALAAVVVFHALTAMLFPIGVFPWVMIALAPVFLPPHTTQHWLLALGVGRLNSKPTLTQHTNQNWLPKPALKLALVLFFAWQVVFPWRYLIYGPNLFWHEQGYRFSWRVMLMEKAGHVFFYTQQAHSQQRQEFNYHNLLTPTQIKMLATQPDFIVQFAHYLSQKIATDAHPHPPVYAQAYVTLNGSGSMPFTNPNVDLTQVGMFDNFNKLLLPPKHSQLK